MLLAAKGLWPLGLMPGIICNFGIGNLCTIRVLNSFMGNSDFSPPLFGCCSLLFLFLLLLNLQCEVHGGVWELHAVFLSSIHGHSLTARNVPCETSIDRIVHYTWRVHQLSPISCAPYREF